MAFNYGFDFIKKPAEDEKKQIFNYIKRRVKIENLLRKRDSRGITIRIYDYTEYRRRTDSHDCCIYLCLTSPNFNFGEFNMNPKRDAILNLPFQILSNYAGYVIPEPIVSGNPELDSKWNIYGTPNLDNIATSRVLEVLGGADNLNIVGSGNLLLIRSSIAKIFFGAQSLTQFEELIKFSIQLVDVLSQENP